MEQCENKAKMLIISILFICKENQNLSKKNLTALELWRNVYVCGGCREEKFSNNKFIMDIAKVIKKSLHLQRITTTKNILIWKTLEWCRG